MSRTIDPIHLAQFMVLPGAAELVEAFAALPPGAVRDSAVSHVQVLARAVGYITPPDIPMGETAGALDHQPPPRLQSPFAEGLTSASLEGQIVERALRGEPLHVIAGDMGVKLGLVTQLMAKARKEGGVAFPGDDRPGARVPLAKAGHGGKRRAFKLPVPPPPYWWEDPASPVWDNPKLLPGGCEPGHGTLAAVGPLDRPAFATMNRAAARRDLTLRQYIAQRLEILRRVEDGELPLAVANAMGVKAFRIYELLTAVGRGRWASGNIQRRAAPAQPAAAPRQGFERWGFADAEAQDKAREQVRDLRMRSNSNASIERQTGFDPRFVNSALDYWKRHGVEFPPLIVSKRAAA